MRLLWFIVFLAILPCVTFYVFLEAVKHISTSISAKTSAIEFSLLSLAIPPVFLIGIPIMLAVFFAAFHRRRK